MPLRRQQPRLEALCFCVRLSIRSSRISRRPRGDFFLKFGSVGFKDWTDEILVARKFRLSRSLWSVVQCNKVHLLKYLSAILRYLYFMSYILFMLCYTSTPVHFTRMLFSSLHLLTCHIKLSTLIPHRKYTMWVVQNSPGSFVRSSFTWWSRKSPKDETNRRAFEDFFLSHMIITYNNNYNNK